MQNQHSVVSGFFIWNFPAEKTWFKSKNAQIGDGWLGPLEYDICPLEVLKLLLFKLKILFAWSARLPSVPFLIQDRQFGQTTKSPA